MKNQKKAYLLEQQLLNQQKGLKAFVFNLSIYALFTHFHFR